LAAALDTLATDRHRSGQKTVFCLISGKKRGASRPFAKFTGRSGDQEGRFISHEVGVLAT
jgi:hypothetical protein